MMNVMKMKLGVTALALLWSLGAPSLASAQTIDTCPVEGGPAERQQFLLSQLPAFNSPENIHQAWRMYRLSHCRFEKSFLDRWPSQVPLFEKGHSDLVLSGEKAAEALKALGEFDRASYRLWEELSAELLSEGAGGNEITLSLWSNDYMLGSAEGARLCGKEATACYTIALRQEFQSLNRSGLPQMWVLSFDLNLSLACNASGCKLVRWNADIPALSKMDPGSEKGVSSSAGGIVKEK